MKKSICISFMFFTSLVGFCQKYEIHKTYYFSLGHEQIKEYANYGLVFRGPSFNGGYEWVFQSENKTRAIGFSLGVGVPMAKGITGIDLHANPLNYNQQWHFAFNKYLVKIGPAIQSNYYFQLYPSLQSGFDFWLSSHCLGLKAGAVLPEKFGFTQISLYSALLGFTSRTEQNRNPYFYNLCFKDVLSDMNSNYHFTTMNKITHVSLTVKHRLKKVPHCSLAYSLDYMNYTKLPVYTYLNQYVTIIVKTKSDEY